MHAIEQAQVVRDVVTAPDKVKATTNRLQLLLRDLRTEIAAARSDRRWSAEVIEEQVAEIRGRYQAALSAVRAEIDEQVKLAERASAAVFTDPEGSVEERTLSELQLQRTWQRAQRALEAGEAPEAIAQRAARDGDRDTFRVLRQELPSFLRARGDHEDAIGGALEMVRRQEVATLPTDHAEALRAAATVSEAAVIARLNVGQVETEVTGAGRTTFLATSKNGPTLDVSTIGEVA